MEEKFIEVISLIRTARYNAVHSVNRELIDLYWKVGEYISKKVAGKKWGHGVIQKLANYILRNVPEAKGFSAPNIWRMKQFYETYQGVTILSALLRELSWTNNVLIFSRSNTPEEREFYLRLSVKEKYSSRELEHQINSSFYERTMISNQTRATLPEVPTDLKNTDISVFRDTYILDFLNLPQDFEESDLRKAIVHNLRKFFLEFGRDLCFIGEEYRLQVGNNDYFIDLLFYHRDLKCLVVIELKTEDFKPEHLGKLNFYLEALDRDVKKPHENPTVGIILCKSKDREVVEYALSRNLSPALIAEYKIKLIDKSVLQKKLHELFEEEG
ncbi:MAG: PDDEXK nuclease domain-containing protein [Proteobacteria bacterium]|nr:PDDEXK nuclease domain-containing protein [Pseudomonadota bacterium]